MKRPDIESLKNQANEDLIHASDEFHDDARQKLELIAYIERLERAVDRLADHAPYQCPMYINQPAEQYTWCEIRVDSDTLDCPYDPFNEDGNRHCWKKHAMKEEK